MRITESTQQQKKEKGRLTTLMKVYRISRKDIAERSEYHYISVCNALDTNKLYWNQDVIDLAEKMIAEKIESKKNPQPVTL